MRIKVVLDLYVDDRSLIVPLDGSTEELRAYIVESVENIDGVEVMKIDAKRR